MLPIKQHCFFFSEHCAITFFYSKVNVHSHFTLNIKQDLNQDNPDFLCDQPVYPLYLNLKLI